MQPLKMPGGAPEWRISGQKCAKPSIIPYPADFVKCFFRKKYTKIDPEICAVFLTKTLDGKGYP